MKSGQPVTLLDKKFMKVVDLAKTTLADDKEFQDKIPRICVLGGQSVGKSSILDQIACLDITPKDS
jgi:GTP-binding protein EngB required for normal cell division